jgi:16S rRNA (guanine527-N7)-methyltransferase
LGEGPFRALLAVLEQARALGFLGPGPVEAHVERALDGVDLVPAAAARALDLGSGGGVPGLPLALARSELHWVLLDGSIKRAEFLRVAVEELGLAGRVEVRAARAEEAGREPGWRRAFDLVTARSFGPPAVTAECGAPFLEVGGTLLVAEPPETAGERWPADRLGEFGLQPVEAVTRPSAFQLLRQIRPCPDRYPRRVGIPAKRPRF